jgi:hypothetical protein
VIGKAHRRFWECYDRLPDAVRRQADKQYALWQRHPFHPSLHFKLVKPGLWSARVDANHRALARARGNLMVWFWIGTHDDYERLLRSL